MSTLSYDDDDAQQVSVLSYEGQTFLSNAMINKLLFADPELTPVCQWTEEELELIDKNGPFVSSDKKDVDSLTIQE